MATTRIKSKDKPPPIPTNQRPNMNWCAWCCYHGKLECDFQTNQPCSRCAKFNRDIHTQPAGTPLHDCYQADDGDWPATWRQGTMEKKLRNAAVADNLPPGVFPDNANGRFIGTGDQQPPRQQPNQQQARGPPRPQNNQNQQRPPPPPPPRPQSYYQQQAPQQYTTAPLLPQYHPPSEGHPYGSYGAPTPPAPNPLDVWHRSEMARLESERAERADRAAADRAAVDRAERAERAAADRAERADRAAADRLWLIMAGGGRNLPAPVASSGLQTLRHTLVDQQGRLSTGNNTAEVEEALNTTVQQESAKNKGNKRKRQGDQDDEVQSTSPREPSVPRGRRNRRSDSNANQKRFDKSTFFQNGRPA